MDKQQKRRSERERGGGEKLERKRVSVRQR